MGSLLEENLIGNYDMVFTSNEIDKSVLDLEDNKKGLSLISGSHNKMKPFGPFPRNSGSKGELQVLEQPKYLSGGFTTSDIKTLRADVMQIEFPGFQRKNIKGVPGSSHLRTVPGFANSIIEWLKYWYYVDFKYDVESPSDYKKRVGDLCYGNPNEKCGNDYFPCKLTD